MCAQELRRERRQRTDRQLIRTKAEVLKRYEMCCDLFNLFDLWRLVGRTPAEK